MKMMIDTQKQEYRKHKKEYNEVLNAILKIEEEDSTHYNKIIEAYLEIVGDCACGLDVISIESHIIAKYIYCCDYKDYSKECRMKLDKIKNKLKIK